MSIVIISNENDQSTANVIEWLHHYNKKVYRINETPAIIIESVDLSEKNKLNIRVLNELIPLEIVQAFWYRKADFSIETPRINIKKDFPLKNKILFHLRNETKKINEYIHYKLLQKKSLGNIFNVDINKIITLEIAQNLGIRIPPTLITTQKKKLLEFKRKHKDIICKAISEAIMFSDINIGKIFNYTGIVSDDTLNKLNNTFSLSLFQGKIEKKYELRIFYMDGDFYSMAIFSQSDSTTATDFRRYNLKKPNRTVPYNLPKEIKDKLRLLMGSLNLNTGSIDMAVNLNNEYIFFEVNPVGQYGMTSYPCNYYLDKKIAEFLIKTNG